MIYVDLHTEDGETQHLWISKDTEAFAKYKGMQSRQEEVLKEIERLETGKNNPGETLKDPQSIDHLESDEGTDNSSDQSRSSGEFKIKY